MSAVKVFSLMLAAVVCQCFAHFVEDGWASRKWDKVQWTQPLHGLGLLLDALGLLLGLCFQICKEPDMNIAAKVVSFGSVLAKGAGCISSLFHGPAPACCFLTVISTVFSLWAVLGF